MPTYTPNFNLALPLINDASDEDQWGGYLNQDLSIIDSALKVARDRVITAKSANYSVVIGDRKGMFTFDATSGNLTVPLLSAATAGNGFELTIKKTDASVNTVTIDPDGAETVDGAATIVILSQNDSYTLVSNGTNWFIQSRSTSLPPSSVDYTKVANGFLIGQAYAESSALATITGVIPVDNTKPQITEGTQVLTVSITPKLTTSLLRIKVKIEGAPNTNQAYVAALFQGAAVDSIATTSIALAASFPTPMSIQKQVVSGTTSPLTFSVRIGNAAGSTYYFNGISGVAYFDGSYTSSIMVEEIKA